MTSVGAPGSDPKQDRRLGLGFRVWGLGFWGLGFRVWGLGFWVSGLGFRVWGLGFRVWGFRVWGLGLGSTLELYKMPKGQGVYRDVWGCTCIGFRL